MLSQRQKQKSLLIDPSNRLHFNVMHENIHMRKVMKSSQSDNKSLHNLIPPSPNQIRENKLYYSVVEKESQSGISFNSRLFFLRDDDLFGYVSKADLNFDVQSAKEVIPLKSLRKVQPKGKILTLEYQVRPSLIKQNDKIIEKKWILRMKDKKMADAWTDIINYQLSQIPSRKSTIQKKQDSDQTENKEKEQKNRDKFQQPIANERPEQDYITIQKYGSQSNYDQELNQLQKWKDNNGLGESPIRQQRSYQDDHEELSPENFQIQINSNAESKFYNSANSLKNNNFILQTPKSNEREIYEEKSYYKQIEENFAKKNKSLKQMLYLPTFINYFRPYLDPENKSKTYLLEIDKKYEDFITFCEITSKQLIDIEQIPLYDFKLSNRFIAQKGTQSKQKLLKEMIEAYHKVFKKPPPKFNSIESLLLLFQNILYVELEDVQIIVPLMQLKILPNPESTAFYENSGSGNKVCQTSLVVEFQNIEKNLSFIYERVLNDMALRDTFLIPMSCQIQYKGFNLFFQSKINENLSKLNSVLNPSLKYENPTQDKIKKQNFQSQNSQTLYKKLGQILCVNPDVFSQQNICKILPFKSKSINQSAPQEITSKYIIIFSDILPYLSSHEVIDGRLFTFVHNHQFLRNRQKQIISQNKSPSQNSSRFQATQRFALLNSETKSVSRFNKTALTSIPFYNHFVSTKQNDLQSRQYKEQISLSIKQAAQKFDKFEISVIHPVEIYEILKSHQLSHHHLGKILQQISTKNSFAKSIIKSEIAAECTKLILFKKCQEIILSQLSPDEDINKRQENLSKTLTTLLNLILGKYTTKQTEMVWKVLTLHAQIIYSVSIFQKDIHKGYFILALVSKFNMIINPSTSSINDIFNNEKFLLAIKFQTCKVKPVEILSPFLQLVIKSDFKELIENPCFQCQRLVDHLGLNSNSIPYFIKRNKSLNNKILHILMQKISSNNLNFSKLNIYENKSLNFTQIQGLFSLIPDKVSNQTASSLLKQKQLSLKRESWEDNFILHLRRKLQEIQHKIKEKSAFNFVKEIEFYIKEIKVFYEYHPFISQLLQFLSDYYISKHENQNGLECLKVSLANMVAICEGNTNHSCLAKCFLKMGMAYEKMRRYQQALNQFKRAKHCLQFAKQDISQLYTLALIRLAQITLQIDGNINEALSYTIEAQKHILSLDIALSSIPLIVEAYQIEAKCLSIQNLQSISIPKSFEVESRPQHYLDFLEKLLIYEKDSKNLKSKSQKGNFISIELLQRFLKLILPFYFRQLDDKAAKMMMTYMCEVSENISKKGGVDFKSLETDQRDLNQNNETQETLFYPVLKINNKNLQQNQPKNKVLYNIYEASIYIKRQIQKGSFIVELIEYIEKAEQIMIVIEKQVRMNITNKNQSRASSRMFLMSAKGSDEFDNDAIFSSSDRKNKVLKNQNGGLDDSDPFELQKLLDFSKEGRSITDKNVGYSNRQRKFDSLIRALLVLLGDGFMLHIFEE